MIVVSRRPAVANGNWTLPRRGPRLFRGCATRDAQRSVDFLCKLATIRHVLMKYLQTSRALNFTYIQNRPCRPCVSTLIMTLNLWSRTYIREEVVQCADGSEFPEASFDHL